MILTNLLQDAGYDNLICTLELTIQTNNSLLILKAIVLILLPLTVLWILDLVDELCIIKHKSRVNVDLFGVQLENIFVKMKACGYTTVNDVHVAFSQRCIICSHYGDTATMRYLLNQLTNDDKTLKNWKTPHEFYKHIVKIFTSDKIYVNGKMTPVNVHCGCSTAGSGGLIPTANSSICSDITFYNPKTCDQATIDAIFEKKTCPICYLPKTHKQSHFFGTFDYKKQCGCKHFLEKHGYTITYDKEMDEYCLDAQKLLDRKLKFEKNEAKDEQRNKARDAKVAAEAIRAGAEKAEKEKEALSNGTVVGKNGKDTKTDSEAATAIQSNLNQQQ